MEAMPELTIGDPQEGDAEAIGPMHKQAWLETYLDPENGITEEVIEGEIGFVAEPGGNEFRENLFAEAKEKPGEILYKVVKNADGKVVGFMHGTQDGEQNKLEGIYLLNEAKGSGIGDRLVQEFLSWADKDKPSSLQVFTTNERAIGFYRKHGFEVSYEPPELKGKNFAYVEMTRPAENQ